MSTLELPKTGNTAIIEIHSVHFAHQSGQAIPLRDHVSDQIVGTAPEWVRSPMRDELSAFVRGTISQLRVVFRGHIDGDFVIGAESNLVGIQECSVHLTFDPGSNLSGEVEVTFNAPLPNRIGLHHLELAWYVRVLEGHISAGTSVHRICTTWRLPLSNQDLWLTDWVYLALMEWTCQWAAGLDDEKEICDAIITNVSSTNLRYSHPLRVRGVRQLLLQGGGMCGDWYHAFQQMAHCQGVFVHRRSFRVDCRVTARGEEQWRAIVIRDGGLNQPHPTQGEADYFDNGTEYPIINPVPIVTRREHRYRFWGRPGYLGDGHCVNFLEYQGRLFLYDACFGLGPIKINAPLPPMDPNLPQGGAELAVFKASYLDHAIDYMLGSLYNGVDFHRCVTVGSRTNGMTVKTSLIPELVNVSPGLTFRWTD